VRLVAHLDGAFAHVWAEGCENDVLAVFTVSGLAFEAWSERR
jgi:hypothetical protein